MQPGSPGTNRKAIQQDRSYAAPYSGLCVVTELRQTEMRRSQPIAMTTGPHKRRKSGHRGGPEKCRHLLMSSLLSRHRFWPAAGQPHGAAMAGRPALSYDAIIAAGASRRIGFSRSCAIDRHTASSHPPGVASSAGRRTRICDTRAALDLTMSNIVHPSTIHRQHLCRNPA
jgi:hypothetical protein